MITLYRELPGTVSGVVLRIAFGFFQNPNDPPVVGSQPAPSCASSPGKDFARNNLRADTRFVAKETIDPP
jgi:hypothetical protein